MEISQRLKAIAFAVNYQTIADIGTDHGYIPVFLAKTGKIDTAAACDIKKGPLARAKETVEKYGFCEKIDLRLGGGLSRIVPGEFETCVIAGMGGMLIIDILKESPDCAKSFSQLVLQPQLDVPAVRQYLHTAGFKIDDETMVCEDRKYYTILSCSPGTEENYSDNGYLFGKLLLEKKDPVLKSELTQRLRQIDQILSNRTFIENANKAALLRNSTLNREAENLRGVLRWL